MKKILYSALLLLLWSCEAEEFNYQRSEVSPDQVTRIDLFVGTDRMIADGHAKLQFIVEAYREGEVTDAEGNTVMGEVPVKLDGLPEGAFNIYLEKGAEDVVVGPESYSTDDATPGTATFYAKIGDIESVRKTVILRPAPVLPPKRYVDVVFHVFELDPTDATYSEISYQELDYELLVTSLEGINTVINNVQGGNPNAASANIEFRMATHDPDGRELDLPGYNRINYLTTTLYYVATSSSVTYVSFQNYMDGIQKAATNTAAPFAPINGASRVWDPDRYLNIVVTRLFANSLLPAMIPEAPFQVVPEGGAPQSFTSATKGVIRTLPLSEADQATAFRAPNSCIFTPMNVFWPGFNRPISLIGFIGKYYGLINTRISYSQNPPFAATYNDFCTDTQRFKERNGVEMSAAAPKEIVSYPDGYNGEKFYANNATDDVRYPSLRNNVTLDQVTRIRYVLENCPGRQNGKTE